MFSSRTFPPSPFDCLASPVSFALRGIALTNAVGEMMVGDGECYQTLTHRSSLLIHWDKSCSPRVGPMLARSPWQKIAQFASSHLLGIYLLQDFPSSTFSSPCRNRLENVDVGGAPGERPSKSRSLVILPDISHALRCVFFLTLSLQS